MKKLKNPDGITDNKITSNNFGDSIRQQTNPLLLFAGSYNSSTVARWFSYVNMNYMIIYSDGEETNKVAEFYPAKCTNTSGCTDSTNASIAYNKVGMYDIIRDRFFVNQGSGADFTAGPAL